LDVPREWGPRDVRVYAYAPEHVFSWRRGPIENIYKGSAGTIFEKLLALVNKPEATIITKGSIWRGGKQREETINPHLLNEDLLRLYERSGEEYQWRPVVKPNGKLIVYADWTASIGEDTEAILQEGFGGGNIEWYDRVMVEDGPIINDLLGYGEGATWQDKPTAIRKDIPSRNRYGLRQASEEFWNLESDAALVNNTKQRLFQFRDPAYTFSLHALNVGDTWRYCRLGNTLTLKLDNMGFGRRGGTGFEATIRVVGMRYDPAMSNKLELVVIEVTSE